MNAYGTHHLHLDPTGTEELLYINFSREDAFLVMLGDHNSFDDGTLAQAIAEARVGTSDEIKGVSGLSYNRSPRENNQLQRRGISTAVQIGDHTVIGALLSTAGTSLWHTVHADSMTELIDKLDPQLDNPGFASTWFEQNGKTYPATPAFEWVVEYCDLYLVETTTSVGFPMLKWRR